MLETYLINLDRSPDRLAAFAARNRHLPPFQRFAAVDGQKLSRAELYERGVFTPEVDYTDGAVGATLSHLSLWDLAITQDKPITIVEDDAIFNVNFVDDHRALLNATDPNWHLFMWGYNFDSPLLVRTVPHISPFSIHFSQHSLRGNWQAFQDASLEPRAFKLVQGCGLACYSVSSEGARILKEFCVPIRKMWVKFEGLDRSVSNYGLDIMMNAIYIHMNAYVCFPPLVVALNDHAASLSQPPHLHPARW